VTSRMRVHFIAVGGAVMHNLAIALHKKGYQVTGSDDEIFEPSKGNLAKYSLLPENNGWFPEKLNNTYYFSQIYARELSVIYQF